MCRIFCSPDKEQRFNKVDLWSFFEQLERSMGKDGNGVYNLTLKEGWKSATIMPKRAKIDGGILFHTRLATHGLVRDYNCQPFDNEKYVLTHNGGYTGIESHARLLGFQYSSKKYSDSYMMAWVMEKVGILNFYTAFKDKRYGVIVVYEKETDKVYLLKTGGSFEYGVFKDGIYIYGSSHLNFWKIEEKAVSMDNGLYILSGNGFTQLDEISTYTYNQRASNYGTTSSHRGGYYGNLTPDKKPKTPTVKKTLEEYVADLKSAKVNKKIENRFGKGNCVYCGDPLGEEKYIHYGNKVCGDCFAMYNGFVADGKEEPIIVGISALFAESIPKRCMGCNWVYKRKCWFGGIERDKPLDIRGGDGVLLNCNTKSSVLDIIASCSSCDKQLANEDKWGIYKEVIMCEDCSDYAEEWGHECRNCQHYLDESQKEPCQSCWDDGIPRNWRLKDPDINPLCADCYFEDRYTSDEPCSECFKTDAGMSEWLHKDGDGEGQFIVNPKCWVCGWHFENWEDPVKDVDDNLICADCEEYVDIELPNGQIIKATKKIEDAVRCDNFSEWDDYKFRRVG